MAKRQASKASYQKEATDRVLTLTAVAVASAIVAALAAWLITLLFPDVSHDTRVNIFGYSFLAVFGLVCGLAVYKVDKSLNRKYDQNP